MYSVLIDYLDLHFCGWSSRGGSKAWKRRTSNLSCTDSNRIQGHVKQQKPMVFPCLRDTVNSVTQTSLHIKLLFLLKLDYDISQLNLLCAVSISWREPPYCRAVYSWVHPGGPMTGQQCTILLGIVSLSHELQSSLKLASLSAISANSASLLAHMCSSWQHCAVNFLHTNQWLRVYFPGNSNCIMGWNMHLCCGSLCQFISVFLGGF